MQDLLNPACPLFLVGELCRGRYGGQGRRPDLLAEIPEETGQYLGRPKVPYSGNGNRQRPEVQLEGRRNRDLHPRQQVARKGDMQDLLNLACPLFLLFSDPPSDSFSDFSWLTRPSSYLK